MKAVGVESLQRGRKIPRIPMCQIPGEAEQEGPKDSQDPVIKDTAVDSDDQGILKLTPASGGSQG